MRGPSRTAVWVAAWRGFGGLAEQPVVDDPLAVRLIPPGWRHLLRGAARSPSVGRTLMAAADLLSGGLVWHLPLRTRAIDDVLVEAAGAGLRQVVLLGAGLDARGYRLAALRDVTVYEVDHPDTQAAKRSAIGAIAPVAKRVVHVAVDFTRDDLADALERAGQRADLPTVFVWEGVTMYLSEGGITSTLRAVSRRSAPGSRLAVTYLVDQPFLLNAPALRVLAIVGEPILTSFEPPQLAALLARHGWSVQSDAGDGDWSRTYRGRGVRLRMAERLAVAVTCAP